MVKQEDVVLETPDVAPSFRALVVLEMRVDVPHEACDFRPHAVLHGKDGVRQIVVDESLKEREVQLVVTAQLVHSGGGPQLLVVADQDQVLALLMQGRHHVGFQHLQTQSQHLQTQSQHLCRHDNRSTVHSLLQTHSQYLQTKSQHLETDYKTCKHRRQHLQTESHL